jgi:hypothetical protein
MIVKRLYPILWALSWVVVLLVTATVAIAQSSETDSDQLRADPDNRKKCELIRAKRGGSAELIPEDSRTPEQASLFPYVFDDGEGGLREDFRVEDDRRRKCLAGFGIFQNAAASSGGATTAAAGGAAAAAPGGVAAAGAGIGTISAGVAAAVGLGAIVVGAAVGVASAGGNSGNSTSTTCTTCSP